VQQVREHLGHISLRAVERYLHSLPGADNGAAGAIARVKETGTLYPVMTPSYSPVASATAVAAPCSLGLAPEVVLCEIQSGSVSADAVGPVPAPVPQLLPTENPGPGVSSVEVMRVGALEAAAKIAVDGGTEYVVTSLQPSEDTLVQTALSRWPGTDSHQRPRKRQRGKSPQLAAVHGQDHRNGDRHATDTPTTPYLPDGRFGHAHRAETDERELIQLPASSVQAATREDGRAAPAIGRAPSEGRTLRREPTGQASNSHVRGRRPEDPLTSGGQRIKKPTSLTTGDRL
jgi:hypothetical protein